jgi:DNA-binding ferritin-like protein (Dps family)
MSSMSPLKDVLGSAIKSKITKGHKVKEGVAEDIADSFDSLVNEEEENDNKNQSKMTFLYK